MQSITKKHKKFFTIVSVVKDDYKGLLQTLISTTTQSFSSKNFEHIVIDAGMNASKNKKIAKLIKENFFIKYIAENDDGIYYAMNKGIKKAQGEWILFLNTADILYAKDTLLRLSKYIQKKPSNHGIIAGKCAETWKNQIVIHGVRPVTDMPRYMPSSHQAMVIKAELCKKNMFDTSYRVCADTKQCASIILCDKIKLGVYNECISIVSAEGFSTAHFFVMMKEKNKIRKELYPTFFDAIKMYIFMIKECAKKTLRIFMPEILEKQIRQKKYFYKNKIG